MKRKVLSTHQVAELCNVHLTTVINWVNDGVIDAYTTPGGHRRIKSGELLKFMREFKMPIPDDINLSKKRVLIVDDDLEALEELKEALRGDGYELDFALNGFEAGRKIYRKKPDLILLDFKMPGMDGFQVCDLVKKDPETAHIDIIAVTVLIQDSEIEEIKKSGALEYVPKPIDIEHLKRLIKRLLKNAK